MSKRPDAPHASDDLFGDLAGATGGILDETALQTAENIERPRMIRRRPSARRYLNEIKLEALEEFFKELPKPGESIHVVSNGHFDYWSFVPLVIRLLGRPAAEFYGSTWTMNRGNVRELLALIDARRIRKCSILTGTYFKTREASVCNTLIEGLGARGARYRAFQNHAKVLLIAAPPDWIAMEGSANFTANPRLEQNVVTNDRELFEFHRGWMEDMLAAGDDAGKGEAWGEKRKGRNPTSRPTAQG